jgi:flavorubredoxin
MKMHREIVPGVDWVGYIDWTVRDFHGYKTEAGSTYNAYLIRDEKVVLMDTVKHPYYRYLLANVAGLVPLSKVDYVICQHAEPDHSSALPAVMSACHQAELVCTAKCQDALSHHFDVSSWKFKIVKDGDELSLGKRTIQFFETPMVHWPESTATFLKEEGILFSMDAFGQHYATAARFDDEVCLAELLQQAKTYYANIVMPFGVQVAKTLARLGTLPIKQICPSHGVCFRSHIPELLKAYTEYATCAAGKKKVVVAFASMWDSTRKMAEAIVDGVADAGVDYMLIDVSVMHDTQTVTEIFDCSALAVGSATLNMGIMPSMARMLTYLKGLKPAGKSGLAFGSFGWAPKGGASEVEAMLIATNVKMVQPAITCRFKPTEEVLAACREAGRRLASI